MSKKIYALSVRQPWATLIIAGLKTIEVRSWSTQLKEKLAIHASNTLSNYSPAWDLVPAEYKKLAELRGGIIGVADLIGCKIYQKASEFSKDTSLHFNNPQWFESPCFGLILANPKPTPFQKMRGYSRFFFVPDPEEISG